MKKPTGVAISAVIALLGSLLTLAFLAIVAVGVLLSPTPGPLPPEARLGMAIALATFAILTAWGITTAIGLFRFRNWARISMIVFAALLAFMGITAGPMILLIPPPTMPTPIYGTVRVVMAVFYSALGLLGVFWIYYFSRRITRAAFAAASGGALVEKSGGRPLSISIIGWWVLVSGIICILSFPLRMPATIFIWIISGWTAAIWQVAFGALWIYVGYGLLRLNPTARKIAVALILFAAANAAIFSAAPGRDARLASLTSHFHFGSQPPLPVPQFYEFMLIPMAVAFAVPLWFLIARKSAFDLPPSMPIPDTGTT